MSYVFLSAKVLKQLRTTTADVRPSRPIAHERSDGGALEVVAAAVATLEDDPLTNAGFGNLTSCGCVECDASVMDGRTLGFGAAGALPRAGNRYSWPRHCAPRSMTARCRWTARRPASWSALRQAETPARPLLGREYLGAQEPPGPHDAEARGRRRAVAGRHESRSPVFSSDSSNPSQLDTVGAVCMDRQGNVAAAVSSGGIWLKHTSRVGQAAVYGCGCWAENAPEGGCAVAVSSSGCGEHYIRTALVRQCAQTLGRSTDDGSVVALDACLRQSFLQSPFFRDTTDRLAGILALRWDHQCGSGDSL
nr:threonine aspartase 1-like [Rhipicephalus microplus]